MIVPDESGCEWGRGRLAVDGRDASGDAYWVADGRAMTRLRGDLAEYSGSWCVTAGRPLPQLHQGHSPDMLCPPAQAM